MDLIINWLVLNFPAVFYSSFGGLVRYLKPNGGVGKIKLSVLFREWLCSVFVGLLASEILNSLHTPLEYHKWAIGVAGYMNKEVLKFISSMNIDTLIKGIFTRTPIVGQQQPKENSNDPPGGKGGI